MKIGPQKAQNYDIYSGFQASFNYYACGLLLKVDNANKLINQQNILQMIDKLYISMQNQPKEKTRIRIRDMLIGKVVVSNYGNYSTYKILDIDFEVNAGSATFLDQKTGQQITMKKYFLDKYQITLTNEQQPILVSEIEDQKKQKKTVQLVPEFMSLTGLQDDVNESIRRQVLRLCNKKPDEKMRQCTQLVQDINQSDIQNQCRSIWHIHPQSYTFKGKKLEDPTIRFFSGDLEPNKVSNFQMRKEQFLEKNPKIKLKWLMFYQKEGLDLQQFNQIFQQNTINYGFPVEPPVQIELESNNPETAILNQLKRYLIDQHDFQIVLFLIKQQYKNSYAKIKKECTLIYQIPSQVIVIENLQKNMGSIIGKVVQQITSKTGGYPWGVIANGNIYDVPFILIGATVTKDKIQKNRTIASLVYTVNKKTTKFYNQTKYQDDGSDIIIDIKEMIKRCLRDYFDYSNVIPQRIFFFREGIHPSGRNSFLLNELPFILQAPGEIDSTYSPGIAVCLVDRKPTQKFFVQKDNITKNPQYGTVIDSHVINDKDEYEFKMIPQLVSDNLGCATPTQYSFVHDTSGITQSQMQNLIYAQCFNYSNWNGPIRVPSVVQYAIKNAEQVATNIHQSVMNSRLNKSLWFL